MSIIIYIYKMAKYLSLRLFNIHPLCEMNTFQAMLYSLSLGKTTVKVEPSFSLDCTSK